MHPRDVVSVESLSAFTIKAHSTEIGFFCAFDKLRRVLEVAQDKIGDSLPLVNG